MRLIFVSYWKEIDNVIKRLKSRKREMKKILWLENNLNLIVDYGEQNK